MSSVAYCSEHAGLHYFTQHRATSICHCCRDNLKEAGDSDAKLTALVDDNAAQFAALGLGTLPGRSGDTKRVRSTFSFVRAMVRVHNVRPD